MNILKNLGSLPKNRLISGLVLFNMMNTIDELETEMDSENFPKKHSVLKNKIKKYRQTGLDNVGEYSTENLVFKILRNSGYLAKMTEMKNEYLTDELSLNEFNA